MLMAGSTIRLFANIVVSILLVLLWGPTALAADGIEFFLGLIGLAYTVNGLILAVKFLDLQTPVISAGPSGLAFSGLPTEDGPLEWDEVKSFKVSSLSYYFISIPWLSYVGVRTRSGYFKGFAALLPTSWFGIYFIPTRLLKGGKTSARQMVQVVDSLRAGDPHDPAPEPVRQPVPVSDNAPQLAPKVEDWGRRFANGPKPAEPVGRKAALEGLTTASAAPRKGGVVLLNGKPLK